MAGQSDRAAAIEQVRSRLARRASPRWHMSVMIALAGGVGFLTSYGLLKAGVTAMALRYPVALGAAYLAFLGLLAIWLRRYQLRHDQARRGTRPNADDPWSGIDVVDIPFGLPEFGDSAPDDFGGGGGFAGGGAGGRIPGVVNVARGSSGVPSAARSSVAGGDKGPSFGLDLGALDEGAWVLIPAAIAAAVALGAAIYVVYIAPVLFAELLLDAALAAGLYRRLKGVQGQHWLRSAVRRTVGPALVAAVLLAISGALMQTVYPGASSIGRVWERATQPEPDR